MKVKSRQIQIQENIYDDGYRDYPREEEEDSLSDRALNRGIPE